MLLARRKDIEGIGDWLYSFIRSALDGDSGQADVLAALPGSELAVTIEWATKKVRPDILQKISVYRCRESHDDLPDNRRWIGRCTELSVEGWCRLQCKLARCSV
jgi:hypothetical protein